ncbi:hypothetical protein GCM10009535_24550 [Streptomyces thermocarboxydovorans]|uniref:Uncharacterized protein n=1 Tax=Streptomyces thermocarboxydovorans TaxID=59298 RepID=A0ABN1HG41_9ACTN
MTGPGFRPTHVVPTGGLPTWESPDPGRPSVPLDPLLPVQLLQRQGDWGHVLCSNGWSAWVDARRLLAVPQDPPAADPPMARTADPRPLLLRAEETLARYRAAVTDLADGTLDGETFGARTRGLRIGLVVDGDSLWLYDSDHGRWVYTDGTALHTHAVDTAPGAGTPSPAHPPTQVVPEGQAPAEPKGVVPEEPAKGAGEGPAQMVGEEPTEVAGGEPGRPVAAKPTEVVPEEPERAAPDEPTRVVPPEGTRRGGSEGDGT